MIRTAIVGLAIFCILAWMAAPVLRRWREHLQHAPELADADWKTRVLVAFKGLRIKLLARFMDGVGLAVPVVSAASEMLAAAGGMAEAGGLSLNDMLPKIPLPFGASLVPTQYISGVSLLLGRVLDFLRNRTNTPVGTIDAATAVAAATESKYVVGSQPSAALASMTARSGNVPGSEGDDGMRLAGGDVAARKLRAKAKPARRKPVGRKG